jgi:thiol:disulfide interchange protein DsbD
MLAILALLQASVTRPHVTIDMVPELTAIVPGLPMRVALRFQVEPGWHVYWKNPGESGVPTTAQWTPPAGFAVGPLQYPTPSRLDVAGVVTHVLEGDVVFVTMITPPIKLTDRASLLASRVQYGVCKDVCYPGQATLSVTMPVMTDGSRTSAWLAVDSIFQARLPRRSGITAGFTWNGDRGILSVALPPGCKGESVTFFPEDRDISPAAVTVPMPHGCGPAQFTIPLRGKPSGTPRGVLVVGADLKGYEVRK